MASVASLKHGLTAKSPSSGPVTQKADGAKFVTD